MAGIEVSAVPARQSEETSMSRIMKILMARGMARGIVHGRGRARKELRRWLVTFVTLVSPANTVS
ncbi:hypothetical protein GCM10007881_23510 [Mesorhizobium huakuii]|nr:hypothetical protein GCM10007881_23510 [Mesorhizobium huakuii]